MIIFGVIVTFAILFWLYNKKEHFMKLDKNKKKGSCIMLDAEKYPMLMLFLTDSDGKITVAIFDKNGRDFIGNPTRVELDNDLTNNPNIYDFDSMSLQQFISAFGKDLERMKIDSKKLYYKHKEFAASQLKNR